MKWLQTPLLLWIILVYLSVSAFSADGPPLKLTPSEQTWLDTHPQIRIGVMDAWPPMNFLDPSGRPSGIGADYIKALNQRLGNVLKIVPGPFKKNLEQVKTRQLDALMDVTPKPERKKFLNFTCIYLDIPHVIVAPRDGPYFADENDLSAKTLALEKGFYNIKYFRKKYPSVKIKEYANTSQALGAVARGEADAYAGNRAVAAYIMEQEIIANLRFQGRLRKPGSVLAFGVRKDWPELAAILDKALASLPIREIRDIRRRWTGPIEKKSALPSQPEALIPFRHLAVYSLIVFLVISLLALFLFKTLRRENVAVNFGSTKFRGFVLAGLSAFVLIVALIGWLSLERTKRQHLQAMEGNLRGVLAVGEDRLDLWLTERTSYMARLGRDPELVEITKRLLKVKPSKRALLASSALREARFFFKHSEGIFANIGFFIISPDQMSIGSMRDGNVGTPNLIALNHPKLLHRAFQGHVGFVPPMTSDVNLGKVSATGTTKKPPTMFFIGPVKDKNGKILAAMTLRVDPWNDLARAMKYFGSEGTGETYVFDKNGRMLSPSRFEDQLRQIGLLAEGQSSALNIEIRDPGINVVKGERPQTERTRQPLTHMAASAIGLQRKMHTDGINHGHSQILSNFEGYRNYRGVPVYGTWLWNAALDMGLAVEVEVDAALANYYQTRTMILGILGFTLLLSVSAVLTVLIIGERTSRDLMKARDNLEHKVADRTAELKNNQKRLAQIIDSLPDPTFVIDEKECVRAWNRAMAEMTGISADAMIGKGNYEYALPFYGERRPLLINLVKEWDDSLKEKYNAVSEKNDGVLIAESFHPNLKNGTYLSGTASTLFDIEGKPSGAIESIRDVTEAHEIQEALQENESRVKTILDSVNTGILVINPKDRTIVDVNPVAADMIGLSSEEIIGRICHQFICPRENLDCPILDHGQEIDNAERVLLTAEGRQIPILKTAVPVVLNGKEHLLESFVDISERKAAEEELQRNLEELERFNKLTIDREERMIELKDEINRMLSQLGKPEKYKIVR